MQRRPSVFLVQHATELESIRNTFQVTVLGLSAPASDFEVSRDSRICDANIRARIANHSVMLVIDSRDEAARRDLITFVGSVPVALRPRIVVFVGGDERDVAAWQPLNVRIIDNAPSLREIIGLSADDDARDSV